MRTPSLIAAAICAWLTPSPALCQPAAPITGRADPRCAALDNLMTSFLAEHSLPGAALAVARNNRLLYARGFGHADLDKHEPVQPDSLFRIASVTKPFPSAAGLDGLVLVQV